MVHLDKVFKEMDRLRPKFEFSEVLKSMFKALKFLENSLNFDKRASLSSSETLKLLEKENSLERFDYDDNLSQLRLLVIKLFTLDKQNSTQGNNSTDFLANDFERGLELDLTNNNPKRRPSSPLRYSGGSNPMFRISHGKAVKDSQDF